MSRPDGSQTSLSTRAAAERLIQVAVDLAVDINGHIAVTASGRAPTTGRESFESAAAAGALDEALARELAPSAGLRNLLVQRYSEIRVDLVAAAVDEVLDGFGTYVTQIAAFVQAQDAPDADDEAVLRDQRPGGTESV